MSAAPPPTNEPEPCVEADAVARLLLVSKDTVRRWALTEGLPFIALPGGRKRYVLSQVAEWRDRRTMRQFAVQPPSEPEADRETIRRVKVRDVATNGDEWKRKMADRARRVAQLHRD
jgi:hypothetical protein